ncbi:hypothetical protein Tco_0806537 [Tanacetum coccineum]
MIDSCSPSFNPSECSVTFLKEGSLNFLVHDDSLPQVKISDTRTDLSLGHLEYAFLEGKLPLVMVKESIGLGHKISKSGWVDKEKSMSLQNFVLPVLSIRERGRSFLVLPDSYRRFIQDFSKISCAYEVNPGSNSSCSDWDLPFEKSCVDQVIGCWGRLGAAGSLSPECPPPVDFAASKNLMSCIRDKNGAEISRRPPSRLENPSFKSTHRSPAHITNKPSGQVEVSKSCLKRNLEDPWAQNRDLVGSDNWLTLTLGFRSAYQNTIGALTYKLVYGRDVIFD